MCWWRLLLLLLLLMQLHYRQISRLLKRQLKKHQSMTRILDGYEVRVVVATSFETRRGLLLAAQLLLCECR